MTPITRHPVFLPALLFLLALGVRLAYLMELPANPLFDQVLDVFDHYNFDRGAVNFSQGDWLATAPNNNYAPLYKYFLGFLYSLFGRDFYAVYTVQFVMGAVASVLVYLIGRDLFGRRAGIFAYLLFALYTTEIIYEGIILRAAFIAFWGIAAFYLLMRLRNTPGLIPLATATLALSLFFQGRPNTLLCLPFVAVYLHQVYSRQDKRLRARARWVFTGTLFLSFIPLLVQCYLVHGRFVLFDASGPHTFISGNLIPYSGVGYESGLVEEYQKKNILSYLSNLKFLIGHIAGDPIGFVELYLRKIYFFFNGYEAPTNISVYLYREYSRFLPFLLNQFAVISALGLMGIVIALKNRKNVFLLYSFALALTLSVVIFLNESRYRIPAVPWFALFGGYALSRTVAWAGRRQYKNVLASFAVFAVLLTGFWPWKTLWPIRDADFNNMAQAYLFQGDLETADQFLDRAMTVNPLSKMTLFNKGQWHSMKKEWKTAAFYYEKVVRLDPEYGGALNQLLLTWHRLAQEHMDKKKDFRGAVYYLNRLLRHRPGSPELLSRLAYCRIQMDDPAGARKALDRALERNPDYAPARQLLQQLGGK